MERVVGTLKQMGAVALLVATIVVGGGCYGYPPPAEVKPRPSSHVPKSEVPEVQAEPVEVGVDESVLATISDSELVFRVTAITPIDPDLNYAPICFGPRLSSRGEDVAVGRELRVGDELNTAYSLVDMECYLVRGGESKRIGPKFTVRDACCIILGKEWLRVPNPHGDSARIKIKQGSVRPLGAKAPEGKETGPVSNPTSTASVN